MEQLNIQIFIFYLIYSDAKKEFCRIMQRKEIWFVL